MKTHTLLASLAVAVTASASDLPSPSALAQQFAETETPNWTGDLRLHAQANAERRPKLTYEPVLRSGVPRQSPEELNPLRKDAPRERLPETPFDEMTPRAKPWHHNGQKFWIVPLA